MLFRSTPPLSHSDGSSISGKSQSSIDLSQIDFALSNATHPMPIVGRNRVGARARGTSHRRRYSKSHISRSSVYETIEEAPFVEEKYSYNTSASLRCGFRHTFYPFKAGGIYLGRRTRDYYLRKYYALRDEAENVVVESKRTWLDTPFHFSLYKVRVCFLLPLSFIYYLHQLSKHQEARPGCKLF